jgi:hypothetical protein
MPLHTHGKMKLALITMLHTLAYYNTYANPLSTLSTSPAPTSTGHDNDVLGPITVEVSPNGIVVPGYAKQDSRYHRPSINSPPEDLEIFSVIENDEKEAASVEVSSHNAENNHNTDPTTVSNPPSARHDHFRSGGLHLGHGPVVQRPRQIIPTSAVSDAPSAAVAQPIQKNLTTRFLVVPLHSSDRAVDSRPSNTLNSPEDRSSATESAKNGNADGSPPREASPSIPKCLSILQPLRDLADRLVFIKEAPRHTLISACRFQSINRTHYDGQHIERMEEICWNLFETIQLEGRRRFERCISKIEDKYQHNSRPSADGQPYNELESVIDKFSFHAYQLTPASVKSFIKEHPEISPEDIEWLNHDMNATSTITSISPNKGPASGVAKRSWASNLFKAIFAAEVDTAIGSIGKGVDSAVRQEVQEYRDKMRSQNDTSDSQGDIQNMTESQSDSPSLSNFSPRQSNRVYIHGQYYPIGPINKYVNHPRDTDELPLTTEDIASYLEFIRDTKNLNRQQFKLLRHAVDQELNFGTIILDFNRDMESKFNLGSAQRHSKNKHTDKPRRRIRRSGPPPALGPSFRYPYQWDFPDSLSTDPAYINLVLAWNNTVSTEHKDWIRLQLRNVWLLRVGDLCNISRSWTKDLSQESQEIELRFKGLTLQRCKEICDGTRENVRVEEYWKSLRGEFRSSPPSPTPYPIPDDKSLRQ